jgi:hypothetical protein
VLLSAWVLVNALLIPQLFSDDFAKAYKYVSDVQPSGIVSTPYSAPWTYAASTWSYMDNGDPSPPNLDKIISGEQYVWIKGALGDANYAKPSMYICWRPKLPSELLIKESQKSAACSIPSAFNRNTQLRPDSIFISDNGRFMAVSGKGLM